jgi:Collagen triple helix repeat (20 copies)
MKSWKIQSKIFIAIFAIVLNIAFAHPSSAASKSVKLHTAGRTATSLSNTILNGVLAPKSTQGIDGDFFIDTKALNIYGPKTNGRWPTAISLRGIQGIAGTAGTSGSNGTDGRNAQSASAVVGAQGATGAAGAAGVKGEAGVAGASGGAGIAGTAGVAGAQGVAGAAGAAGVAGSQGVAGATGNTGAQGNIGNTGNTGAQGLKGETGTAGVTGSKGETGTVGAAGPSSALFGVITFAEHISGGGFPSQSSNVFGLFEAEKDYAVRFHIFVVDPTQFMDFSLSVEFTATGATPTMKKMYSISKALVWNGADELQGVSIIGEVSIEGSTAHSGYNLIATVTTGTSVGTHPLTLTGNFQKVEIGTVTQTS